MPLWAVTANYSLTPTMFLEASIGHAAARPGRLRAERRRRQLLHRGLSGQRRRQPRQHGPGRPAVSLSRRQRDRSGLLPVQSVEPGQSGAVGRHAHAVAAQLRLRRPGGECADCAAQQQLSRVRRPLVGQRLRVQPDQARWASHHQGGLLPSARAEAAESGRAVRDAELQQRHEQPARFTVPVLQRRTRHFSVVRAGVEVHRRHLDLQQRRVLHPGQLEGHQPADVRLRHAVRPPAAPVRQYRTVG